MGFGNRVGEGKGMGTSYSTLAVRAVSEAFDAVPYCASDGLGSELSVCCWLMGKKRQADG